jgi:integrase
MGKLYRRHAAGNWYGDYRTPEGQRRQHSLRTKDKQVAKERLRLAELGASPDARGKKQRLMDAIDGMIDSLHDKAEATRSMYREKGRRILKTIGNPNVDEVTYQLLNSYIKTRKTHPAAGHTIQKELITIRRALKYALKLGTLRAMPHWPEFSPEYVPRKTWLTPQQFAAMAGELEQPRRLWATLAALGGMRAGEVERLDWSMVDLARNRIHVPGTKTTKSRRGIPIAPALRHELERVPSAERAGPVVEPWSNVRRDLHAACVRAKVTKVSPNDLRRTFASWMVQAGAPLLTVAALLGHSSTRMLERVYGQLSAENLESAVELLPPVTDGVTESWGNAAHPDTHGENEYSVVGKIPDENPTK